MESTPVKNTFIHFADDFLARHRSNSAPPEAYGDGRKRKHGAVDRGRVMTEVYQAEVRKVSSNSKKQKVCDDCTTQQTVPHLQPQREYLQRFRWADVTPERDWDDEMPQCWATRERSRPMKELRQCDDAIEKPLHWQERRAIQQRQQQHQEQLLWQQQLKSMHQWQQFQQPHQQHQLDKCQASCPMQLEQQFQQLQLQDQLRLQQCFLQVQSQPLHPQRPRHARVGGLRVCGSSKRSPKRTPKVLTRSERYQKRKTYVQAMKTTEGYKVFFKARQQGDPAGAHVPSTPDASDDEIGKRPWEDLVAKWRFALRQFGPIPFAVLPEHLGQCA